MKRTILNIYNLHKETIFWKKLERKKEIIKYLIKKNNKYNLNYWLIAFKKWDTHKHYSLSYQTNVCKNNGKFKKTLDKVGINRHMLRQNLNLNKIPNLKKLSW